ncbi:MAG: triple tyrosine motif-containing protein [Blastocatellia bacterium]
MALGSQQAGIEGASLLRRRGIIAIRIVRIGEEFWIAAELLHPSQVGTRRTAYYSYLPPGNYTFHVIAANRDGVWNTDGALVKVRVLPPFYKTNWFLATCAAAFLAMLWLLYQLRIRQLAHQFNMTLEARVSERTRKS